MFPTRWKGTPQLLQEPPDSSPFALTIAPHWCQATTGLLGACAVAVTAPRWKDRASRKMPAEMKKNAFARSMAASTRATADRHRLARPAGRHYRASARCAKPASCEDVSRPTLASGMAIAVFILCPNETTPSASAAFDRHTHRGSAHPKRGD